MSKITTKSGFVASREANKITSLCDNSKENFNTLWIWPASAMPATGKRTLNVGDIYIGEKTDSGSFTPDVLTKDDLAFQIKLPEGETKLLRDVIFQADSAGDGVFFKYW